MSKPTTRQPKSAAPAVYSAVQIEAIFAKSEAAHAKIYSALNETIEDFKDIMAAQNHQIMKFRGLSALAKATGVL